MHQVQQMLVNETLAALRRNLAELDRLQALDVPDPVAIAHIQDARSLLDTASGLVRRLREQP